MQAPGSVRFLSDKIGGTGRVDEASAIGGTSIAAPHVAGAAALIKDQHIREGQTWINNPGRLHTVMLAMGDRHRGTGQANIGFDYVHGAGKLKLQYITNYGTGAGQSASRRIRTHVSTTSGTYSYLPFEGLVLPAGTQIVKCVLMEDELMSDGADVDDIWMEVNVRDPGANGVCESSDPLVAIYSDASYDLKHMVAITNSNVSLSGKCIEVDLNKYHISSDGYAQVHSYCYYNDNLDDES